MAASLGDAVEGMHHLCEGNPAVPREEIGVLTFLMASLREIHRVHAEAENSHNTALGVFGQANDAAGDQESSEEEEVEEDGSSAARAAP